MIRWLGDNLGTLFLAFMLAVVAWVSAVNGVDPIEERPFPRALPIEYKALSEELIITGDYPTTANVIVRAPRSTWDTLSDSDLELFIDLSDLTPGQYRATILDSVNISSAKVTAIDPESVTLTIEPLTSSEVPIEIIVSGDPALGFRHENPIISPQTMNIYGPQASVDLVAEVHGEINLGGRNESFNQLVSLAPVDDEGRVVDGVQLEIESARVEVPILEAEQFRPVSVIAELTGEEELQAAGYYRISGISVTPNIVVIFSSDQEALDALPGFVKTVSLDVSALIGDTERRLALDLPDGLSLVGDQTVTVIVKIDPIQTSITVNRPVETIGEGPGLYGYPSPKEVSVFLTGPRITLDFLTDEDVTVVVDLFDLGVGTYQLEPQVVVLPPDIEWEGPIPAAIEVTVSTSPPPTPTPLPPPP